MKKLLAATAIVAALGAALPAAAQSWNSYGSNGYGANGYNGRGGWNQNDWGRGGGFHDIRSLERQIDRGVRSGALTQSEARSLGRQLDDLERLQRSYARGGVSYSESRELDRRFADLERRLRFESHDRDTGWGRGYGQGYGRGFDGYR